MTITVSVEDDLAIAVTDDGIGMPTTVARSSLHNLNSRALTCGGTFTVERQPEGGTKVLWSVPLP
jgi:signal transduction histidine kinase